jgi:integrase
VPVDLQHSLGNSDIRRTLRTSDRRIAIRRAWSLMQVVEDAFEVLRSSGLGPDARAAFAAILDHVIDDFDREGRQVGNRAKYRTLLDLVPGGDPGTTRPEGSEAVLRNLARLTPQIESSKALASLDPADFKQVVSEALAAAKINPEARALLSSKLKDYLVFKNRTLKGNKHLDEIGTKIGLFIGAMGDRPIHEYSITDLREYRDLLDQMPRSAKARFKTDDIRVAIALNQARKQPYDVITPTTIDAKYLSCIRGYFEWLVNERIIDRNPADGVSSERDIEGEDVLDVDKRLPFDPVQCAKLDLIVRTQPAWSIDRWWWPIMQKTGLRLEEIAQLTPADFRMHNGRLCIDLLHMEDGDAINAARREALHIKSSAGRRVIPLPRSLIEDDRIMDLVEKRQRESGALARLFPDETPDRYGNFSTAASKRINRLVDQVSTDPRYVGYSARHTFAALCDAAGVPVHIRDRLMGHQPQEKDENGNAVRRRRQHVRNRYGSPILSAEQMAWIDKLAF